MTNQQITSAYVALSRMGNIQMPLPIAYKLFLLRQKFKQQFDFVAEQERVIVEKHNGTQNEHGDFQFADKATAHIVYDEMCDLREMECEIEFEPVNVELSPALSGTLSMNDFQALEGIVTFE